MHKQIQDTSLGLGIAMGAGVGTALGVALENLALWLPIGTAIGLSLGAAGMFSSRDNNGDSADKKSLGDKNNDP